LQINHKEKYNPAPTAAQGQQEQDRENPTRPTLTISVNNMTSTRRVLSPEHPITVPVAKDSPGKPGVVKSTDQLLLLRRGLLTLLEHLLPSNLTVLNHRVPDTGDYSSV
jgi:hypothetical protein